MVLKDQLKELLQGVLDLEVYLVFVIVVKLQFVEFDVLFFLGVGEVFFYICFYNVFNNLQSIVKDQLMVMFFLGFYIYLLEIGVLLDLFGRLYDDKYYCVFNIFYYEV